MTIKRFLKNILGMDIKPDAVSIYMEKNSFKPNFIGIFINPFYFARKGLYANIKSIASPINGHVLDAGCGIKPYKELIKYEKYDGLEIDTDKTREKGDADFFYNGKNFPFKDGVYDSVICNQVLEHVFEPNNFLKEINRVMKKDGFLLLTVPFIWDEHEQPYDYARYSSFGVSYLLNQNGFKVVNLKKSQNNVSVIFQMINGYLYKKTLTPSLYFNIFMRIILMAPFNILGIIFSSILPTSQDIYLDNVVLAQKN